MNQKGQLNQASSRVVEVQMYAYMNVKCIALDVRNCKELYENTFLTFSHCQCAILSTQEKNLFEVSQELQRTNYNHILMKKEDNRENINVRIYLKSMLQITVLSVTSFISWELILMLLWANVIQNVIYSFNILISTRNIFHTSEFSDDPSSSSARESESQVVSFDTLDLRIDEGSSENIPRYGKYIVLRWKVLIFKSYLYKHRWAFINVSKRYNH